MQMMLESSSGYEFKTFAVGTRIKPSIVDRDDFIRSKFKLIGTDGIKTRITGELAKKFSRRTGKPLDRLDPDITLTVDTGKGLCQTYTKPIILQGSYSKTRRGLPQKQSPCLNCAGAGCRTCKFHGIDSFESVEGRISQMLFSKFDCTTVKFTWIGGEDRSSLVLGAGRLFFARIRCPAKRSPKLARNIKLDSVELHGCRIRGRLPKMPVRFFSTVRIRISTKNPLTMQALRKLKRGLVSKIAVYEETGKRSGKSVTCVRYRKISERNFDLTVDAEGGLPIKRFVRGDNVQPGVSQILGDECTCVRFDFIKVYQ